MEVVKNALKKIGLIDRLELETFKLENQPITKDFEEDYLKKLDKVKADGLKAHIKKCNGIIPFPKMATNELRVWGSYCPTKQKLEEYNGGIIPSGILDLIVESKPMFGHIEIWSEAKEVIDPIVVGVKQTGEYSWEKDHYLLARWGESLKPFHEICKIVIEKAKESRRLTLEKMKRQIETALLDNELTLNKYFNGDSISDNVLSPNAYGV